MIKLAQWKYCFYTIFLSFSPCIFAADIYRSKNIDETYRYASQPLDSSYKLYLKSESHKEILAPPTKSSSKRKKVAALEPLINKYTKQYGVDAALVRAVIEVESNFNPLAISPKGATGVMQLMPATAARYGVINRHDTSQNIEAGVRYLKDLLVLHNGNVSLALASYNAGEGTVAKYGMRLPPYKETMLYVPAVLMRMQNTSSQ